MVNYEHCVCAFTLLGPDLSFLPVSVCGYRRHWWCVYVCVCVYNPTHTSLVLVCVHMLGLVFVYITALSMSLCLVYTNYITELYIYISNGQSVSTMIFLMATLEVASL